MACSHLYFYLNVLPSILIARTARKYVMVNYRGGEAGSFFEGHARFFLPLFNKADQVTVPSGYLQEVFAEVGLETTVLPNIIRLEQFRYRLPRKTIRPSFICTRNFEPYYDIPTVVRAFTIVKTAIPSAELVLIPDNRCASVLPEYVLSIPSDRKV